jgi:hypothetical protein
MSFLVYRGFLSHLRFPHLAVILCLFSSGFLASAQTVQFSKLFVGDPLAPGSLVPLQFTIVNNSTTEALTNLTFTDDLDAALTGLVAVGLPLADICGPGSQISGTSLVVLTGGSLAPSSTCTITLSLQIPPGATPGSYINTTSDLSGMLGGNFTMVSPATDFLEVGGPSITLTKEFLEDPVVPGATVTLSFTIANDSTESGAIEINFTDDLDAALPGLEAIGLPVNDVCGTGSVLSGTSVLSLTAGELTTDASCDFQVVLQVPADATPGDYLNTTSVIDFILDAVTVPGNAAVDTLTVEEPLSLTKSFIDDPVLPGSTVTLEFVLVNSSTTQTVTDITFTDDLDAVLTGLVATGLPMNDVCGVGSQLSGTSLLTLTGGTLLPGATCTFSVTLQVPAGAADGTYPNTTSMVSGMVGTFPVDANPASDSLVVNPLPPTSTPTASSTATSTPTSTLTATQTPPPTATASSTPTETATEVPTSTSTATETPTITATATSTATPTATLTATATETATPTSTVTVTATATVTETATSSATLTPTPTQSVTETPTSTSTPTASGTATPTATGTVTSTASSTQTATPRPTSTVTATPTTTSTLACNSGYYLLDSFGGRHRVGDPPLIAGPVYFGTDAARDLERALCYNPAALVGPLLDLVVLDTFGATHRVASGPCEIPQDFYFSDDTFRAVDLIMTIDSRGFWVLADNGTIWRAGTAKDPGDPALLAGTDLGLLGTDVPLPVRDPNLTPGGVSLRAVAFVVIDEDFDSRAEGYVVLDSMGGRFHFDADGNQIAPGSASGAPANDPARLLDPMGHVWPFFVGLDIARDMELHFSQEGVVILDGWDGIHPVPVDIENNPVFFANNVVSASDPTPAQSVGLPYVTEGFDDPSTGPDERTVLDIDGASIFWDLEFSIGCNESGLYVLDRFGGVFALGDARPAPSLPVPAFTGSPYFFPFLLAEDMELFGPLETGFSLLR